MTRSDNAAAPGRRRDSGADDLTVSAPLAEVGERSAAAPGRLARDAPRPESVARIVPDE